MKPTANLFIIPMLKEITGDAASPYLITTALSNEFLMRVLHW